MREEFVDVESRGSQHDKQSNDPPPKFTATKPSEFKSYRKKVRQWLLFTRTPAQSQEPRVLSRLTGPAWDACDRVEPEVVATADGVNMILDTLAEAFRVNTKRNLLMLWRTLSMDLAGRRVRGSMTMHYGCKTMSESWPNRECGCRTKYRVSFCCVERT